MKKLLILILSIIFLSTIKYSLSAKYISSCTDITTTDTYYLTADIINTENRPCIRVLSEATIDCQGKSIIQKTVNPAILVDDTILYLNIRNCLIKAEDTSGFYGLISTRWDIGLPGDLVIDNSIIAYETDYYTGSERAILAAKTFTLRITNSRIIFPVGDKTILQTDGSETIIKDSEIVGMPTEIRSAYISISNNFLNTRTVIQANILIFEDNDVVNNLVVLGLKNYGRIATNNFIKNCLQLSNVESKSQDTFVQDNIFSCNSLAIGIYDSNPTYQIIIKDNYFEGYSEGNTFYKYYLEFANVTNTLIYNNKLDEGFDGTRALRGPYRISWNVAKTCGATNIVGGPCLGGNFWYPYGLTCNDNDNDFICDEPWYLGALGADYLPLKHPTAYYSGYLQCYVSGNNACANVYITNNPENKDFTVKVSESSNCYDYYQVYSTTTKTDTTVCVPGTRGYCYLFQLFDPYGNEISSCVSQIALPTYSGEITNLRKSYDKVCADVNIYQNPDNRNFKVDLKIDNTYTTSWYTASSTTVCYNLVSGTHTYTFELYDPNGNRKDSDSITLSYTPVVKGNKICEIGEDEYNAPEDCPSEYDISSPEYFGQIYKKCSGEFYLFIENKISIDDIRIEGKNRYVYSVEGNRVIFIPLEIKSIELVSTNVVRSLDWYWKYFGRLYKVKFEAACGVNILEITINITGSDYVYVQRNLIVGEKDVFPKEIAIYEPTANYPKDTIFIARIGQTTVNGYSFNDYPFFKDCLFADNQYCGLWIIVYKKSYPGTYRWYFKGINKFEYTLTPKINPSSFEVVLFNKNSIYRNINEDINSFIYADAINRNSIVRSHISGPDIGWKITENYNKDYINVKRLETDKKIVKSCDTLDPTSFDAAICFVNAYQIGDLYFYEFRINRDWFVRYAFEFYRDNDNQGIIYLHYFDYLNPGVYLRYYGFNQYPLKMSFNKELTEVLDLIASFSLVFNTPYAYYPEKIFAKAKIEFPNGTTIYQDFNYILVGREDKIPWYYPVFTIYNDTVKYTISINVPTDYNKVVKDWTILELTFTDEKKLPLNITVYIENITSINLQTRQLIFRIISYPTVNNKIVTNATCTAVLFTKNDNGEEIVLRSDLLPFYLIYNDNFKGFTNILGLTITINSDLHKWIERNGVYAEGYCSYTERFVKYEWYGNSSKITTLTVGGYGIPTQVIPTNIAWFTTNLFILIAAGIAAAVSVFNEIVGGITFILLLFLFTTLGQLNPLVGIPAIIVTIIILMLFRYHVRTR